MIFKPSATNNIFIEVNAYVAGFSKMCFETTQFNEPMKTHINQLNGGVTVNLTALRCHCNVSSNNCPNQQKTFICMQTLTRLCHNNAHEPKIHYSTQSVGFELSPSQETQVQNASSILKHFYPVAKMEQSYDELRCMFFLVEFEDIEQTFGPSFLRL